MKRSEIATYARKSALLVLRLAKQHLACLVIGNWPAQVGEYLDAALHRRSGGDCVKPDLKVRIVGPVNAVVLPVAQPRKNSHVGNAVLVAGNEFAARKLLVCWD